jgi:dTDP-4-dehydrorhamnose 3,5-epimerase
MQFQPTPIPGAYVIEPDVFADARGYFARIWCAREFAEHGLDVGVAQCNLSGNTQRGTVRGMHYQLPPHTETKLVRCVRGALLDVVVDLRPDSPAFLQWYGVELTEENRRALYVPVGCAHGYQALLDDTVVYYQMSQFFEAGAGAGVRWDDPRLRIQWPLPVTLIAPRDQNYPDLDPAQFGVFAAADEMARRGT